MERKNRGFFLVIIANSESAEFVAHLTPQALNCKKEGNKHNIMVNKQKWKQLMGVSSSTHLWTGRFASPESQSLWQMTAVINCSFSAKHKIWVIICYKGIVSWNTDSATERLSLSSLETTAKHNNANGLEGKEICQLASCPSTSIPAPPTTSWCHSWYIDGRVTAAHRFISSWRWMRLIQTNHRKCIREISSSSL